MSKKKIIVVTGGIGSGKSEFCRVLERKYGLPVYDADSRAKKLYNSHPTLLNDIEAVLGAELRDSEGRFVPKKLAGLIFQDAGALAAVENLLFPALMDDFEAWEEEQQSDTVIFESATILEKRQFTDFGDYVVLIDAPYLLRLERACRRDNAPKEMIMSRMNRQSLMNLYSQLNAQDSPIFDANYIQLTSGRKIDRIINNFTDNKEELEELATEFYENLNK